MAKRNPFRSRPEDAARRARKAATEAFLASMRAAYPEDTLEGVLFADGFEEAFLGLATQGPHASVAVYDVLRCIEILVTRDKMTPDEATDFLQFNTIQAWVGPRTPMFLLTRPAP